MKPKPPVKRWTARRVIFLLLVYAAILLLAETAVRIVNPRSIQPGYYGYPPGLIIPDATLGHRYAKNFSGFFAAPRYQDIPIQTNAWGFRDNEWAADPNPLTPRIMVLGDSITFGSPLRIEDRFDRQLWTTTPDDKRFFIETCNCGVNGYNMTQYDILLRQLGPQLHPKIVLIGLCLNDAEPLEPADDARIQAGHLADQNTPAARRKQFLRLHRLDFNKSYLALLFSTGIEEFKWRSPAYGEKKAEEYARKTKAQLERIYTDPEMLERFHRQWRDMRDYVSRELNARLAVIIFPYQHQLYEKNPALSRQVARILAQENIRYADLYDLFLQHLGEPELYAYQDDCHPGRLGHRLAGSAAALLLRDER